MASANLKYYRLVKSLGGGTYAILLEKPRFVAFDDEIHNKLVLMKRFKGRRPAIMFCVSFLGRFINITKFQFPIILN